MYTCWMSFQFRASLLQYSQNQQFYQIGTTTKTGGSLNNPQAPLAFSTNVDDPRNPRVAGRLIFITMKPWMDAVSTQELDKMKIEVADLTRYILMFTCFMEFQLYSKIATIITVFTFNCYSCCFSTKDKALPFIVSLVKRAVDTGFQDRFTEIRKSPLIQELPIKAGYCV